MQVELLTPPASPCASWLRTYAALPPNRFQTAHPQGAASCRWLLLASADDACDPVAVRLSPGQAGASQFDHHAAAR